MEFVLEIVGELILGLFEISFESKKLRKRVKYIILAVLYLFFSAIVVFTVVLAIKVQNPILYIVPLALTVLGIFSFKKNVAKIKNEGLR
jgi:hypothetical protein